MFAWLQWVVVTDEEEAHGGYQELKQLHQGGVAPIWPHLHPSQQLNCCCSADCDVAYLFTHDRRVSLFSGHTGDGTLLACQIPLHQNTMDTDTQVDVVGQTNNACQLATAMQFSAMLKIGACLCGHAVALSAVGQKACTCSWSEATTSTSVFLCMLF